MPVRKNPPLGQDKPEKFQNLRRDSSYTLQLRVGYDLREKCGSNVNNQQI